MKREGKKKFYTLLQWWQDADNSIKTQIVSVYLQDLPEGSGEIFAVL